MCFVFFFNEKNRRLAEMLEDALVGVRCGKAGRGSERLLGLMKERWEKVR
jgi:hypothetical protein